MWNRALATVWCTFCQPHLPKVPRAPQSFNSLKCKSSTFRRLHLPKALRARQCFSILKCKPPSLGSCALFVGNFARSRRGTAETETLLRQPQEPHYLEKHRVSRPRKFSPVNSHFPTTWWWEADMMMWLAWWCGWHDGANANHNNRETWTFSN